MGATGKLVPTGPTVTVRFERRVSAPPEDVWAALTDPKQIEAWLAEAEFEATEGGKVHLVWPDQGEMHGSVTKYHPHEELEYSWNEVVGHVAPALRARALRRGGARCSARALRHLARGRAGVRRGLAVAPRGARRRARGQRVGRGGPRRALRGAAPAYDTAARAAVGQALPARRRTGRCRGRQAGERDDAEHGAGGVDARREPPRRRRPSARRPSMPPSSADLARPWRRCPRRRSRRPRTAGPRRASRRASASCRRRRSSTRNSVYGIVGSVAVLRAEARRPSP